MLVASHTRVDRGQISLCAEKTIVTYLIIDGGDVVEQVSTSVAHCTLLESTCGVRDNTSVSFSVHHMTTIRAGMPGVVESSPYL
eukprot:3141826-Pyramimonas_sp.AAC.2